MRIKLLACEVLARQAYHVAAFSQHIVDVELVSKGLHEEPEKLRSYLQQRLDAITAGQYDAIILGYGLCSNSTAGLVCAHTQMVIPRAHDCITLFLGSRDRYAQEFRDRPGTYWYAPDYFERNLDGEDHVALGAADMGEGMAKTYEEYVAKYGVDNADYLMEVMGAWKEHYDRAAYIDNPDMALPDYSDEVRDLAERRGWSFERIAGSLLIVRDLIDGNWDEEGFVIVPPGETAGPTYDHRIISAQPVV